MFDQEHPARDQNSGASVLATKYLILNCMLLYMGVSENGGFSPQIIHFNVVFHYKSSILGYPYFWKRPYLVMLSNIENLEIKCWCDSWSAIKLQYLVRRWCSYGWFQCSYLDFDNFNTQHVNGMFFPRSDSRKKGILNILYTSILKHLSIHCCVYIHDWFLTRFS